MPQLENCVKKLVADPNFKPKDPKQTKRSAAYALCTASISKAMDNIQETITILKQFEDSPSDYNLLDPNDYSTYGEYDSNNNVKRDNLEVSTDSLTDDGNPLPPELSGLSTSDITDMPNPPVDVNFNDVREPANVLGNPSPNRAELDNVDNLRRISDMVSSDSSSTKV